jgi:hypothetical protein
MADNDFQRFDPAAAALSPASGEYLLDRDSFCRLMVSRRQLVRCQSRRYPAGLLDLATGERYVWASEL